MKLLIIIKYFHHSQFLTEMKDDDSNRTNKTSEGSNEVPNLVDALDGSNGARSLFVQSQFMACAIFVLFVTYF